MKYLFWMNKLEYARRLLRIVIRMQNISNRLKLADRYRDLETRRFELTEDFLKHLDDWFYDFNTIELGKLDADTARFAAFAAEK